MDHAKAELNISPYPYHHSTHQIHIHSQQYVNKSSPFFFLWKGRLSPSLLFFACLSTQKESWRQGKVGDRVVVPSSYFTSYICEDDCNRMGESWIWTWIYKYYEEIKKKEEIELDSKALIQWQNKKRRSSLFGRGANGRRSEWTRHRQWTAQANAKQRKAIKTIKQSTQKQSTQRTTQRNNAKQSKTRQTTHTHQQAHKAQGQPQTTTKQPQRTRRQSKNEKGPRPKSAYYTWLALSLSRLSILVSREALSYSLSRARSLVMLCEIHTPSIRWVC